MNIAYKMMTLCTMGFVLGMVYGLQSVEAVEKNSDTLLSYPSTEDLKKQKEGQHLSPQEEQLQIDEDNVMNTFD